MGHQEATGITRRNNFGLPFRLRAEKSNVNNRFTWNSNRALPWLVGLIAGAAIGVSLMALDGIDSRARAAEAQAAAAVSIAEARASTASATAQAAQDMARIAEREARMQQYYMIELDAKLIKEGFNPPHGGYSKYREQASKQR